MCLLHGRIRNMAQRRKRSSRMTLRYSPNMRGHNLSVLGVGMGEDVLNQVVAILVTGNLTRISKEPYSGKEKRTVNQRNARTIRTAFADAL